jgi:maltooligosyltrehalose trehalohydrolase
MVVAAALPAHLAGARQPGCGETAFDLRSAELACRISGKLERVTTHGPRIHTDGTTTFRLWAPNTQTVSLELGHGRFKQMEPAGDGWFTTTIEAAHGQEYAYSLGKGQARPDPASRWQPKGVHAPSRLFNPARLEWSATEAQWRAPQLAAGVIYELHVGTFTPQGTFDAATTHLDDLAALGVTHVEVMPVNAFNGERGWGYDGVDWYAVHEPYGGPEGFARFVDACHRLGLAVILDVVYNHLGPSGNYLSEFGPYVTDRYTTPWGGALNLDGPGSDPVRAFVIENALGWFNDFHVDALRLDAVHALVDTAVTHILAELADATGSLSVQLGRPLELIAESDRNDPQTVRPREVGGLGFDAQWADDLHHTLHVAVTGEQDGYYADYTGLPDVARAYRCGFVFGGRYSPSRQKTVGAPLPDDVSGHRLIGCIQNHDQVGNRACGDRLTTLASPALVRCTILLLCAAPHVPLLFMGEEYGETRPFQFFTSHPEPDLAKAVSEGRRAEFAAFGSFSGTVPDPQDPTTRDRSVLDRTAAETETGRGRLLLWTDLLHARRTHPALGNGRRDLVEVVTATQTTLALVRRDPRAPAVLIMANFGAEVAQIPAPPGPWRLVLSTDEPQYAGEDSTQPWIEVAEGTAKVPSRCAALLVSG